MIRHMWQRRRLRASLLLAAAIVGTSAAPFDLPQAGAATASADVVVLGGGQLTREYTPDAGLGDHYVVAVVTPSKRTVSLFFTSTLPCTGDAKSFVTYYSKQNVPVPKSGTVSAVLPVTTAEGWTGKLSVRLEFGTSDFDRAKGSVISGELHRSKPKLDCSVRASSFNLRVAHPGAKAATKPGSATKGGAYLGAAADATQRTAVLLWVSADGREVTNRAFDLFLDCKTKKVVPFLEITDYGRIPLAADGSFKFREEWGNNGAHFGMDPKYRVALKIKLDGRFNGPSVAGVAHFDGDIIDVASQKVVDTCTSGDQSFEASI